MVFLEKNFLALNFAKINFLDLDGPKINNLALNFAKINFLALPFPFIMSVYFRKKLSRRDIARKKFPRPDAAH